MKKIFKLVILTFALSLIITTSVSAKETKTFTLNEAIDYALKNNGDILLLKFQEDQLGYAVTATKDGRKMAESMIEMLEMSEGSIVEGMKSLGLATFDSYLMRQKFTENQLSDQKKLLNKTYVLRTELIKLSVENAYYNIMMKKIAKDDAKRNRDVVYNQTEVGRIKLKYGTISEIDCKSLEINLNAAELNLVNADYAYEEAKMDFCDLLGLDYDVELNLTTPLEVKQIDININDKKKQDLIDNDLTYQSDKLTYDYAEQRLKYAKAYYGTSSTSYKTEQLTFKSAEITWNNAKKSQERRILSTYNKLDVLKKTVGIYSDKKDLMNAALGIANIRLKYQTATEDEVIQASINYNQAVNDYYDMVMNYNMMASLFEKNIMVG